MTGEVAVKPLLLCSGRFRSLHEIVPVASKVTLLNDKSTYNKNSDNLTAISSTVLGWRAVNELKDELKAKFVAQLDHNFAKIYLLNESSYLVMPLNPFGNSLLTTLTRSCSRAR